MLNLKLESKELSAKAMQLINLTEEWLNTFLPHCLQKSKRAVGSGAQFRRFVR
jgi:hypothetical protein